MPISESGALINAYMRFGILAAVRRLEQAGVRPGKVTVFPRGLSSFPENRVYRLRIRRIERHFGRAGILILVENLLERLATVRRAEHAALSVRSVRVPEHRDKDAIGILGIDDDLRDLLSVAKAEVRPCLARIIASIDA